MTKTPEFMTPQQMQMRSSEKVKQIMELMKLLEVRVEAKQHINQQGFIEQMIFWIDDEKYPTAPVPVEGPQGAQETPAEAKGETPVAEAPAPKEVKKKDA